ncbi:MAG: WYL domain-containing protein [Acidobacteria bacterium]|nr:WYL domain-containing protein [Acidobacteriota bacterium]
MNITERINRILFIMSFVSQNQGVTVDVLARQVGMRPRQLLKELDFMLLIGKPPFRPDDYVDIYVEDQRVYIEFDQMLNRPLRFTRPEAMALLISLQLLDPEVNPAAVKSLKEKIQRAVSSSLDPAGRLEDSVVFDQPSRPVSEKFRGIRDAIEDQRKVEIDYYSLTRDRRTRRVVHPYFLTKYLGYWYLTAYCELRKDVRTFKFERLLSLNVLNESFPPPTNLDVEKYKQSFLKSTGPRKFEIHFDPAVASYVAEQWGTSVRKEKNGGVILTLFSETMEFPSRIVLNFAPHARPLSPPELIEKVHKDARQVLQMYESKAVV